MANYKVYLSSTFRDLEDHRKAILELFRYISDDFLITAMEGYTAEDTSALKKCIADVEKCDIYILLIASRYGHIPKNNELDQNPGGKSITELEYDTAVKKKKRILVYLAATENNEGITFMEDEEGPDKKSKKQKLEKFRSAVSEDYLSPRAFVKSEELRMLVSASIIKLVIGEPIVKDKKLNENLKYCCDRSQQFIAYEQNRISGASLFHVFVTNGHQFDSGGNLANRCAIFSLNLTEQDILPIGFEEFYNSDSDDMNRERFIYQLHKKLVPEKEIVTSSLAELKDAVKQKTTGNILVRINCYEEFLDEARINSLVGIFKDLHNMCSVMYDEFKKRIYFFLNVEDNYEDISATKKTREKILLLKEKAVAYNMNFVSLSRFELANKEHINNWIENYITKDQEQRDELYDNHFIDDLPGSFRLRAAEKSIRRLFTRIRENDFTIIKILNKKI